MKKLTKKYQINKLVRLYTRIHNKRSYTLTSDRYRKIDSILNECGYVNCFRAIYGLSCSPYHKGDNSGGKKYNDLIRNIFKSPGHVFWVIENYYPDDRKEKAHSPATSTPSHQEYQPDERIKKLYQKYEQA